MSKGANIPGKPDFDAQTAQYAGLQETAAKLFKSETAQTRRLTHGVQRGMERTYAANDRAYDRGLGALEGQWDESSADMRDWRDEMGRDADRTAGALEGAGNRSAGEIRGATGQAMRDVRSATGQSMSDVRGATGRSMADVRSSTRQGVDDLRNTTGQAVKNVNQRTNQGVNDLRGSTAAGVRDIRARSQEGAGDLRRTTGQALGDIRGARGNIDQLSDRFTGQMNDEYGRAAQLGRRQSEVYQPLEDEFVAQAKDYNTAGRRDLNAGRAMADVASQFSAQREQAAQNLQSYGIDPSQLRSGALDYSNRAQQAAAQAGAGTMSRERTEDTGRQLLGQAVEMGRYTAQDRQAAMGNAQGMGGQALQGRGMSGDLATAGGQIGISGYGQAGEMGMRGAEAAGQLGVQGYGQAGQLGVQGSQAAGQLGISGYGDAGRLGVAGNQAAGQLGISGYGQAGQLGISGYGDAGRIGIAGGQAAGQAQMQGLSQAQDTRMQGANFGLASNQALMAGQGALSDWRFGNRMDMSQAAVGNDLARTGQGFQAMQIPYQNMGFQSGMIGQQAGLMQQNFDNRMARSSAKQQAGGGGWGATLGSMAGMAIGGSLGGPMGAQMGAQMGGAAGGGVEQQMYAEGGPVHSAIPDPSGRGDTVPMWGSDGEVVIPRSVVMRLGTDHFEKLIQKFGDPRDVEASRGRQAIPVN